jgi:hypothetical protein
MAAILDHLDIGLVAWIHSERKSRNHSHTVGDTVMGASSSALVLDNIRLCDFWRGADFARSVRDAQTFLEICLRFGRRIHIQQ